MRKYTRKVILCTVLLSSFCAKAETVAIPHLSIVETNAIAFQLIDSIYSSNDTLIATSHTNYYVPAGGPCGEIMCNGEIAVLINGGIPPYTFSISNGESFTTSYNYSVLDSLCVGQYTYTITDSLGQIAEDTLNITQTPSISINIDLIQEVICAGSFTGAVGIITTGGTPPFIYEMDNGSTQLNNYFGSLTAGTHTSTVTDDNGCTADFPFTLDAPTALQFTNTITSIICGGDCLGEIDLTATGATPPYSYSFNNGLTFQSSNIMVGLCAGNVNVVVADSNGCLSNTTVTITENPPLTFSPTFTEPSCNGVTDGTISFNAIGGAPPYVYQVDNGLLTMSQPINNLSEGTYVLYGYDTNGCELYDTIVVTTPPPFSFNYISNNPATCGVNDGSFEVTAFNGSAPYIYSIDGGVTFQINSGFFTNLFAGLYMLNVTDANGCQDSTIIALPNSNMTTQTDLANDAICFSNCDGEIEASALTGISPYNYYLNFNSTPQATGNFTNLCAGQYFILIEDDNQCLGIEEINIAQPDSITFDLQVDNPCPGATDGQLTIVNILGGTGGLSYSIDGGLSYQGSPSFNALSFGDYDPIIIQDINGCFGVSSAQLIEPTPWAVTISKNDLDCFQDNSGFVQLIGDGATAPYTYDFDGASGSIHSSLAAGTYPITFTDVNACTFDTSIVVNEPLAIALSVDTFTNPQCFGGMDGAIDLQATGGTPNYFYSLDGGTTLFTFDIFNSLSAGTYTIYVEDSNGCTDDNTLVLNSPTALIVDTTNLTSILCSGLCEGSVELNMSNGTSPYIIYTSSGNIGWISSDNYQIDSMCVGTATIQVIDDLGCVTSIDVPIQSQYDLAIDTFGLVLSNCFNECIGEVSLDISNGNPPYNVTSNLGLINPINSSQFKIDSICNGNLIIGTTDADGCYSEESVTFIIPDSLYFTYNQTSITSCTVCTDGVAEITAVGGTPPYTYDWSDLGSASTSSIATDLAGGSGAVCITDANGCTFCDSVTVDFIDDVGITKKEKSFRISPNPAQNEIWLISSFPLGTIQLFDINGKLLLEYNNIVSFTSVSVDVSAFPNGIYLLKASSENSVYYDKLVIQN
jgi:Secretion system C-terminal sorting domain/SprB repeat